MFDCKKIQIADYNYDLPDERIAKYPLPQRDGSKLLIYRNGKITDSLFKHLPEHLPKDTLLVFNNTRVIQARLPFQKETGAAIEVFCLEPHAPSDYLSSFQQNVECTWMCLVGNSKKWKEGVLSKSISIKGENVTISIERVGRVREASLIRFSWDNPQITFADILDNAGELPIPPYLNRDTEEKDKETYQTVYSKIIGSVAAPTAGLHFTDNILKQLHNDGIKTDEVTLHVGAGTFKPVQAEEIGGHEMHSELISVRRELRENLLANEGRIIAVGTTSVRTLESLYYIGQLLATESDQQRLFVPQWMPYESVPTISTQEALTNILSYLDQNNLDTLVAHTAIMIVLGYEFKVVKGIITNFHQPQSTLLLLISAFAKGRWMEIYEHALASDYRFLSYGDSSLLLND